MALVKGVLMAMLVLRVLEVKLGEMVKQVQLAKELLIGFSPLPNQVILNLKMVIFGLT